MQSAADWTNDLDARHLPVYLPHGKRNKKLWYISKRLKKSRQNLMDHFFFGIWNRETHLKSSLAYCACCRLWSECQCSRARVRRVAVPKNIQPTCAKCSSTTMLTGKLSSFGFDPHRSSSFSFCFEHAESVWLRVPRPWPCRHASIGESCRCHKLLLNPSNSLFEVDGPSWVKKPNRIGFLDRREACQGVFKLDCH